MKFTTIGSNLDGFERALDKSMEDKSVNGSGAAPPLSLPEAKRECPAASLFGGMLLLCHWWGGQGTHRDNHLFSFHHVFTSASWASWHCTGSSYILNCFFITLSHATTVMIKHQKNHMGRPRDSYGFSLKTLRWQHRTKSWRSSSLKARTKKVLSVTVPKL